MTPREGEKFLRKTAVYIEVSVILDEFIARSNVRAPRGDYSTRSLCEHDRTVDYSGKN